MMNSFYMPTRVYEEEHCVLNHIDEIAALGTKALIVTGKSSARKNGALKDVEEALNSRRIPYIIFDRVEENPSTDTVVVAAELGISNNIDFVIAIGGGSPMDAGKAIALLVKNKSTSADYLYDKNKSSKALHVVAIPTTCGTGSEVTGVSVLTVHNKKTKSSIPHKIFPKLALVDGRYLKAAPETIIKDTALDALSHFFESYINTQANDYCRMLVREGLTVWSKIKPVLAGEKSIEDADYELLMHAATLAGMSIAQAGTTLPHSLSYPITYELGISHGRAVGRFLAGYLAMANEKDRNLMLSLSGFDDLQEFDNFYNKIYGKIELDDSIKNRIVNEVYARKEKLRMVPFFVDEQVLYNIVNY